MKTMKCKQLGGACERAFQANTFDEIAEMSKQHGLEMFRENDEAHIHAMNRMQGLMKDPESMRDWFESKSSEFEALPED